MKIIMPFIILLLSFALNAIASDHGDQIEPYLPMAAKKEILKQYPLLLDEMEVTNGDINGDGISDVAVIIHYRDNSGSEYERLVILTGRSDGGYMLISASDVWKPHMTRIESVGIKNQSIYLTNSSTADSHYDSVQFQFKNRDGTILLIGIISTQSGIDDADVKGVSANLLIGKVIKWTMNKGKRREVQIILKTKYRVLFEKFSFDTIFDVREMK